MAIARRLGILVVPLLLLWSCQGYAQGAAIAIDSLTLDKAVELALQYHPTLRLAEANVRFAEGGYRLALSNYLPQVSASWSGSHTEGTFVFNPSIPSRNQIYSSYSAGITASQLLYDFGKTTSRIGANSDFASAASLDQVAAREAVRVNVAIAYLAFLQARSVAVVNEEAVAQAAKHLAQAKAFHTVGRVPQFDVTKAEVDLANANVTLITARNQERVTRLQLENAMGVSPTTPYVVSDSVHSEPFTMPLDSALALAFRQRPELNAARARVEANNALASATWSQNLPSISATGSYNWNGFQPQPLFPRWVAGISVSLPIFQGFGIDAQVQQAEANADAAQATLDALKESVQLDVEQTYLSVREAAERILASEKLVQQAEENLTLAERQYAAGVGTPLDVTDAQLTRSNAHITNIQAIFDYNSSLVRLHQAVGAE